MSPFRVNETFEDIKGINSSRKSTGNAMAKRKKKEWFWLIFLLTFEICKQKIFINLLCPFLE
jgi:hypothetical protein